MAARKGTTTATRAARATTVQPKRVRKPRARPLYTFSLSPEAHELLERIAASWGASLSATVERLIREERRREVRR